MKVLKAGRLDMDTLGNRLNRYAKSGGFLSKKPIETLIDYRVVYRPFRRVTIETESSAANEHRQVQTLIDEEMAPLVADQDHRMLLWRPRYSDIDTVEHDDTEDTKGFIASDAELQQVVDDMLARRCACQALDEEYRPKLKRLQADPLSALSIVLPRRVGSLKREQTLIDERKESHAYILASSLITNSSPQDILVSSTLGERVFVETLIACYETAETLKRLLVFETPNASSFDESMKAGKALTRLCDICNECRERVAGVLSPEP